MRRAMSQENVEIVRRFYETAESWLQGGEARRAQAGDGRTLADSTLGSEAVQDILGFLDEQVVWETMWSSAPFHGHEGVLRYTAEWMDVMSEWRWTLVDFIDAGESVVGEFKVFLRGQASGAALEQKLFTTYVVRDGKITHYREYFDRASATQAVGLPD
jgi:ketosteroid isomerase-like protein